MDSDTLSKSASFTHTDKMKTYIHRLVKDDLVKAEINLVQKACCENRTFLGIVKSSLS